jgi:hypothetical protein
VKAAQGTSLLGTHLTALAHSVLCLEFFHPYSSPAWFKVKLTHVFLFAAVPNFPLSPNHHTEGKLNMSFSI